IYEKITLVEKELMEIRQFIENAYNNYEKRNILLSTDDLKYIVPYEDNLFLNQKLEQFIEKSKNEIQKAKKRKRNIWITAACILLCVFAVFTVWALRERAVANDLAQIAVEKGEIADAAKVNVEKALDETQMAKDSIKEMWTIANRTMQELNQQTKKAIESEKNADTQRIRAVDLFHKSEKQNIVIHSSNQRLDSLNKLLFKQTLQSDSISKIVISQNKKLQMEYKMVMAENLQTKNPLQSLILCDSLLKANFSVDRIMNIVYNAYFEGFNIGEKFTLKLISNIEDIDRFNILFPTKIWQSQSDSVIVVQGKNRFERDVLVLFVNEKLKYRIIEESEFIFFPESSNIILSISDNFIKTIDYNGKELSKTKLPINVRNACKSPVKDEYIIYNSNNLFLINNNGKIIKKIYTGFNTIASCNYTNGGKNIVLSHLSSMDIKIYSNSGELIQNVKPAKYVKYALIIPNSNILAYTDGYSIIEVDLDDPTKQLNEIKFPRYITKNIGIISNDIRIAVNGDRTKYAILKDNHFILLNSKSDLICYRILHKPDYASKNFEADLSFM
ncbi:MAG: hypothetical protein COZ21_07185, partial [Bacteroidetes bacterium CG_4_10_14_3_um_filter_31_20]